MNSVYILEHPTIDHWCKWRFEYDLVESKYPYVIVYQIDAWGKREKFGRTTKLEKVREFWDEKISEGYLRVQ